MIYSNGCSAEAQCDQIADNTAHTECTQSDTGQTPVPDSSVGNYGWYCAPHNVSGSAPFGPEVVGVFQCVELELDWSYNGDTDLTPPSKSLLDSSANSVLAELAETHSCAKTYVALGDSYSSGEGAGYYLSGTGNGNGGCDRSENAYPELVARALGYSDEPDAENRFVFAACSGAKTSALFSEFKGEPPQLDELDQDDTLVTVSIGGNDIGFAPVLKYCLKHKKCEHHEADVVARDLEKAEGNILNAYLAIRRQAPLAKIVVVGYPNFMPATGACHPSAGILHYLVELSAADVEFIHGGIEQLDSEIQSLTAGRQGFVFVRPDAGVWSKHTICENKRKSWFVPITLTDALSGHSVTFFHPTAEGQVELATEVKPKAA